MDQKKYFCPRLLDYVIIVGSRHPNRNNSVAQTPELLRRYPIEDHKDFPLPADVVFFCQPEGCISVGPKRMSLRESTSFVFSLTEKDSARVRYGICMNFYRPFERKAHTRSGDGESLDNQKSRSPRTRHHKATSRVRNNTLTSLCIISHHPFFSTIRECLFTLRKLIDACNERSCSKRIGGSRALSRDTVWGAMTCHGTSENTPSLVLHEVREIETWILRLLSAPVPVPGKTRVELNVLPSEIQPTLVFALPDHTRLSLVDFPLHLPLELLGVDTCLKVLTCIILEHKIVLQSRDYNALTMSVMAFVSMLYPLEYMFPVIPLLPTCMSSAEQLLLAPTPYIIGVPASFLMYKNQFRLPNDVCLVDLDANKNNCVDDENMVEAITVPSGADELPPLPEPEGTVLKNHLRQALASMSMSPQPIKNLDAVAQNPDMWKRRDSFSSHTGFNPLIYGNDVDSVDVATRVAMVRFFNSPNILGNFCEHTRTLRLYPRPVVAFQFFSFMKSRPVKTLFTARLARTQAVEYFAEYVLCPYNVVFLRVHTGVFDPALIGDKPRWYSNGLQKIEFNVYDAENSSLGAALTSSMQAPNSDEYPTDESGSDSDGAESTSSSYSSLSDFVTDIMNSDINGDTPAIYPEDQVLSVDQTTLFTPPSKLQVPDTPVTNSDSAFSLPESDLSSDESSSPSYTKGDADPDPDMDDKDALHFRYDSGSEVMPLDAEGNPLREPGEPISRPTGPSTAPVPVNKPPNPAVQQQMPPRQSSTGKAPRSPVPPPRPPLPSQQSLQKYQSMDRDSPPLEGGGIKRAGQPAPLQGVPARPSQSTPNTPMPGRHPGVVDTKSASHLQVNHTPSAASQPTTPTRKTGNFRIPQESDSDRGTTPSSIMSSISNGMDGIAQQASNTISELFGGSSTSTKPAPPPPQPPVAQPAPKPAKPFAPLGNRKALVEKSGLVKHATSKKGVQRQSSTDSRTSTHSENQQFLKDIVSSVLDGSGVGWLKLNKLKKLMEDENYRNFVVSRLNTSLDRKLTDEDVHVEDVCVSKQVFKGMLTVLRALVAGLYHTYRNHGIGGMASTFMIMEIAHTHYWARELSSNKSDSSSLSQGSSPFGSQESLASKARDHSLPEEAMITLGRFVPGWRSNSLFSTTSLFDQPPSPNAQEPEPGSPVVFNGDEFENIELKPKGKVSLGDIRDVDNNRQDLSETQRNLDNLNINKAEVSEGGDILRDLVKNKDLMKGRHGGLPKFSSMDSEMSEASTLMSTGSEVDGTERKKTRINHHTIKQSDASDAETETPGLFNLKGRRRSNSVWSSKSSFSTGFRYHEGKLINIGSLPSPDNVGRTYLFEGLLGKERCPLWDHVQFWEDAFLDAVAQERDIIGLDQGPAEMMERYVSLGDGEKKRLEHDEDRLLSIILYNMVGFMTMMQVEKNEVKKKIRRMLGKSHIGLIYSQDVNDLLDHVANLYGNDIDLKPMGSRMMQKQSFTVHWGTDNTGDMLFMEVCDDCIILRSVTGAICDRWWYEKLVNMTYCPKTKVLCLWRRHSGQTQLNKFYTKKCRELYYCVKEAMEKAATRNNGKIPGPELGGEFPVQDLKSGQGGLLQVCMEGIGLLFANSKFFVDLSRIKKCYTQKGAVFVLEEFDPKTRKVILRKYKSNMANQICYAVLCVFSYVAAGIDNQKQGEAQHGGIDNLKHQLGVMDNQKQQLVIDNNNRDTS
ncbi:MAP kinase-activating death domain protein-like isoform X3 [Lineus longissimus]|uniref:MAP kinase-activating death domain protein-like isoform X3 n=1 Tax=Lineus longissimus TaxID=88925 RepID=UPI00315D4842